MLTLTVIIILAPFYDVLSVVSRRILGEERKSWKNILAAYSGLLFCPVIARDNPRRRHRLSRLEIVPSSMNDTKMPWSELLTFSRQTVGAIPAWIPAMYTRPLQGQEHTSSNPRLCEVWLVAVDATIEGNQFRQSQMSKRTPTATKLTWDNLRTRNGFLYERLLPLYLTRLYWSVEDNL